MERMRKMIDRILFFSFLYPFGVFLGIAFYFLSLMRRIRIFHWERFPHWQGNLILVANHPTLLEPFLLPALLFREYFFYPLTFAPWSTPDKKNYYDPWYCFWLRPRLIPIDRKTKLGIRNVLAKLKKILSSDGIVILFPEGGRTFKGGEFLNSKKRRKVIRKIKEGVGWLAAKTEALIVPIWLEGTDKVLPNNRFPFPRFWKRITIKIGKSFRFQKGIRKKQATEELANALLKLADEDG